MKKFKCSYHSQVIKLIFQTLERGTILVHHLPQCQRGLLMVKKNQIETANSTKPGSWFRQMLSLQNPQVSLTQWNRYIVRRCVSEVAQRHIIIVLWSHRLGCIKTSLLQKSQASVRHPSSRADLECVLSKVFFPRDLRWQHPGEITGYRDGTSDRLVWQKEACGGRTKASDTTGPFMFPAGQIFHVLKIRLLRWVCATHSWLVGWNWNRMKTDLC